MLFTFNRFSKKKTGPLSRYPCDSYLHNALQFISEGDYENAYTEICYSILKSGGSLSEKENKKFKKYTK